MLNKFNIIFKKIFSDSVIKSEIIKGGFSDRLVIRLSSKKHNAIGVYNNNIKENIAFSSFSKSFKRNGLNVPSIYHFSRDKKYLLIEDLGKITLHEYSLRNSNKRTLLRYYKKALNDLIDFQIIGGKCIDFSKCYQTSKLSVIQLTKDYDKFNQYFVNEFLGIKIKYRIKLLQIIVNSISGTESEFFVYRDFQPRNIIIKKTKLHYVDYQSGRRGPIIYDLASFLNSGSIKINDTEKHYLAEYYRKEIINRGYQFEYDFWTKLDEIAICRLIQILGSYAYNIIVKNNNEIITKIPLALNNLKKSVENLNNKHFCDLYYKLNDGFFRATHI